jgi:hypothetical protein
MKPKSQHSASTKNQWKWKSDLLSLLKSIGGVRRLSAATPSTASIGNWAIIESFKKLRDHYSLGNCGVEANLFMGRKSSSKSKIEFPLHEYDDEVTITKQWDGLRSAFNNSDNVLIFHLTNHYALIFAMREWLVPVHDSCAILCHSPHLISTDGTLCDVCADPSPEFSNPTTRPIQMKKVRQVFTARKGQRPTSWINFEEMRIIMLGWEGYKIMKVQRKCSFDELVAATRTKLADEAITLEDPL